MWSSNWGQNDSSSGVSCQPVFRTTTTNFWPTSGRANMPCGHIVMRPFSGVESRPDLSGGQGADAAEMPKFITSTDGMGMDSLGYNDGCIRALGDKSSGQLLEAAWVPTWRRRGRQVTVGYQGLVLGPGDGSLSTMGHDHLEMWHGRVVRTPKHTRNAFSQAGVGPPNFSASWQRAAGKNVSATISRWVNTHFYWMAQNALMVALQRFRHESDGQHDQGAKRWMALKV